MLSFLVSHVDVPFQDVVLDRVVLGIDVLGQSWVLLIRGYCDGRLVVLVDYSRILDWERQLLQ